MESNMSKMDQILAKVKDRYKQVDNLMTLTKEMEKVVDANDLESLTMVLNMRQKAMNQIDQSNEDLLKAASELDQPYRDTIQQILTQTEDHVSLESPIETNIFDTNKMTFQLLKRIITLDEAVNERFQKVKK